VLDIKPVEEGVGVVVVDKEFVVNFKELVLSDVAIAATVKAREEARHLCESAAQLLE
jgi:hypothetical protein